MGKYLSSFNISFKNDKIIMIDIDTWIVAEWDIERENYKTIARIMPIGGYGAASKLCFTINCFIVGDLMYCVMRNTAQITVINLTTGKHYVCGKNYPIYKLSDLKYATAMQIDNKIYLFPYMINQNIVIFDIKTNIYCEIESPIKMLNLDYRYDNYMVNSYICNGNKIWFAVSGTNIIGVLDVANKEDSRYFSCGENSFLRLEGDKDNILAVGIGRKGLISIDNADNWYTVINSNDTEIDNINAVIPIDQKLFVENLDGSAYIIFQDGEKVCIQLPNELKKVDNVRAVKNVPFSKCFYKNDKIYMVPFASNGIVVIDINTLKSKYFCLEISGDDVEAEYCKRQDMIYENRFYTLANYLDYINELSID